MNLSIWISLFSKYILYFYRICYYKYFMNWMVSCLVLASILSVKSIINYSNSWFSLEKSSSDIKPIIFILSKLFNLVINSSFTIGKSSELFKHSDRPLYIIKTSWFFSVYYFIILLKIWIIIKWFYKILSIVYIFFRNFNVLLLVYKIH